MADYSDEAHSLVDAAIENACKRLSEEGLLKNESDLKVVQNKDCAVNLVGGAECSPKSEIVTRLNMNVNKSEKIHSETPPYSNIPNITWMNIKDFSISGGLNKIELFIQTWKRDVSWLHCIDFLKEEDLPYSKSYRYEVRWSIPTRRKPIPRATASTFFTLDVSKVRPKNYPIEVYYVFEGHRLVHRPGKSRFNEKWLRDIIDSKVHLMQSITF